MLFTIILLIKFFNTLKSSKFEVIKLFKCNNFDNFILFLASVKERNTFIV